jgi:hypothetical protein
MPLSTKYLLSTAALIAILGLLALLNRYVRVNETHAALISESDKPHIYYHLDGDIVFQNRNFNHSKEIQRLTHSKWNQLGIIFDIHNEWYVFESSDQVRFVRLSEWIDKGEEGKYVVKRLKNYDKILTDTVMSTMKILANDFLNRNYDIFYSWDDDNLYNSELVYKIYERPTGIKLAKLESLRDLDFSNPDVYRLMKIKYGDVIPKDSMIISPQAIFDSDQLTTVFAQE